MDTFSKAELETLINHPDSPCVSLYMPMHRTMPDAQQNPIRFRKLIHEAERRLQGNRVNGMLNPAKDLLNETDFWLHPADGLAVFVAPGQFSSFRLPLNFEEMLVVTGSFHTKPLLPLFAGDGRFYVLALSQNEVRVLQCAQHRCQPFTVPNMPANRKEALKYDNLEKSLQMHTSGSPSSGERIGIQHGHGSSTDESKDFQLRFCREVERALTARIKHDHAPLVVAAVDFLHPIYREVNTYPHLLEAGVIGNPELWGPEELHRQAWAVAEPYFRKAREQAAARYEEMKSTERTSNVAGSIVSAAYYGRVDTLFVETGLQQWGKFDKETGSIELHETAQPGDVDLLDAAATQTLLNNGVVYAVPAGQVPDGCPMAAILRY